jgi:hypothetical protein
MIKKVQNYLLHNYPLVWNTKIVPIACIIIPMHLLFFVIGYYNGALDFTETEDNYSSRAHDMVIFFSVLVTILATILWLVFYLKNNAFKAFYPKTKYSLVKEWGLTLIISFMLCAFCISYYAGVDTKIRSYYTENEAMKRCKTLSDASIFYGDNYDSPNTEKKLINDTIRNVELTYVLFNKHRYSLVSLYNKSLTNYSFYDATWDSIETLKVKKWLVNNTQDSVKAVMKRFYDMGLEHHLKGNIDDKQWFSLVYTYPNFIQKRNIANKEWELYTPENYTYVDSEDGVPAAPTKKIDTLNEYIKEINNTKYIYFKTYLPILELEYNYDKIAKNYTNPNVNGELFLLVFYLAFGFSLALFSFRVTSAKTWLITLVAIGIQNILLAILTITFNLETFYLIALFFITVALYGSFIYIVYRRTKKGISGVLLTGLLWMYPFFIPIAYNLLLESLRHYYGYYNNIYRQFKYEDHPVLQFLDVNKSYMLWVNMLFVLVMMFHFSRVIRKWRALADS